MSKLNQKLALVTGGSSGIGFAIAKDLLDEGAKVIITGRNSNNLDTAVKQLGNNAKGFLADTSNLDQIDYLVNFARESFGKIDTLVINAGVSKMTPTGQTSESTFDEIMDINFKGAVFTLEKFLPLLSEGASVINISSVSAYSNMPGMSIYSASKAALNSFTRSAAFDLAPRKIRVNAVNPGPVETPIFEKFGLPQETLLEFAKTIQNRIPLKRTGKPEEIAKLVSFLASDESLFITGSEINIDGGVNINPLIIQ
ncbi:MAG: glucose 1-dehydrogenase [Candidatus Sericytochromatia bacterium]